MFDMLRRHRDLRNFAFRRGVTGATELPASQEMRSSSARPLSGPWIPLRFCRVVARLVEISERHCDPDIRAQLRSLDRPFDQSREIGARSRAHTGAMERTAACETSGFWVRRHGWRLGLCVYSMADP